MFSSSIKLSALSLPPSKWFGFRDAAFVEKRRQALEVCGYDDTNPAHKTGGHSVIKKHLETA